MRPVDAEVVKKNGLRFYHPRAELGEKTKCNPEKRHTDKEAVRKVKNSQKGRKETGRGSCREARKTFSQDCKLLRISKKQCQNNICLSQETDSFEETLSNAVLMKEDILKWIE